MNILPKRHFSEVLSERQLEFLARQLPQPQAYTDRPAYANSDLLPGILKVLRSGCRWRDLDCPGLPSEVTRWRRLKLWQEKASLWPVWKLLLNLLGEISRINLSMVKLDGTLIPSYRFASGVGYSGKHKRNGVKVSALVDQEGLPLSVQLRFDRSLLMFEAWVLLACLVICLRRYLP